MPYTVCLDCGAPIPLGRSYCRVCDPAPKRYRAKRGSGWAQGRFRAMILARARGSCEQCGRIGVPLEAHHLIPVAMGGRHELSNGRALCLICHPKEKLPHAR